MVLEACWLERPDVSHEQEDARIGRQARPQVTDAVRGREPAVRTTHATWAPRVRGRVWRCVRGGLCGGGRRRVWKIAIGSQTVRDDYTV